MSVDWGGPVDWRDQLTMRVADWRDQLTGESLGELGQVSPAITFLKGHNQVAYIYFQLFIQKGFFEAFVRGAFYISLSRRSSIIPKWMTNDGAVSLVERLAIVFRWFDVFLVEMENLQSFPGQISRPYLLKYSTIFVEMKNLQSFPGQIVNHICQTFQIFQNYPENGTLQFWKYVWLNLKFY